MRNMKYYIPGSLLIFFAILIIAVPEILIAFIASILLMVGVVALYVGHLIKKSENEIRNFEERSTDSNFSGWGFARSPIFRRWHRFF